MFEKSTAKRDSWKDTPASEIWSILHRYARAVTAETHADEKTARCTAAEIAIGRAYARVQNRAVAFNGNSNMRVAKPTLAIKGDALALVIDGPVEGIIAHHEKHLTVGKQGQVKGQVHASSVTVVGQVIGDVRSDGVVSLANGAYVEGNIFGARVLIENGARFKGKIDGDIRNDGVVSLANGADVEGSICCARVVIADGARFKGNIDTGEPPNITVSNEPARGESVRSGKTVTVAA